MSVPGEFVVTWLVLGLLAGYLLEWSISERRDGSRLTLRRKAGYVVLGILFVWAGTWVWAILGLDRYSA